MKFEPLSLSGAYLVHLGMFEDERGYFARSWCTNEFRDAGLDATLVQCSFSFNRQKGTLRGMHYQIPPFAETKLVRCTRGGLFDVIIDVRPDSPSFLKWVGAELTPDNGRMLYIPKGCAHGFMTLSDNTEISYQMSEFYSPVHARGCRWDDPLFGIAWPGSVNVISQKDLHQPDSHRSDFESLRGL